MPCGMPVSRSQYSLNYIVNIIRRRCFTCVTLQILQLEKMSGKLPKMGLLMLSTWCASFAKHMAITSSLPLVVSPAFAPTYDQFLQTVI